MLLSVKPFQLKLRQQNSMYPYINLFWPNFRLNAYALMMVIAALTLIFGSWLLARKGGFNSKTSFLTLFFSAAAMFIGSRALHFLINFKLYLNSPELILRADLSGFALFGGIILSIITGAICCYCFRLNFWRLGDTIAPFLGLSLALMRVGCFLNGCCFGKITGLPWGVTFPLFSGVHRYQLANNLTSVFEVQPVHPTQIYELIAALLGSLLAVYLLKKKVVDGLPVLTFALWYTAFRWFNYYLRVMSPTFSLPDYFYPLFYLSIISIIIYFIFRRLNKK